MSTINVEAATVFGLLRRVCRSVLLLATISLAAIFVGAAGHAQSGSPTTVVFVCLHGSVKSQVAAAHFNRIAKERGLAVIAVSRGIAVDSQIPDSIREGLERDGLAPANDVPLRLTAEEADAAAKIFAFDEVPADLKGNAEVTYWSDVPPATKDYSGARSAIVRHLLEVTSSMTAKHRKTAPRRRACCRSAREKRSRRLSES